MNNKDLRESEEAVINLARTFKVSEREIVLALNDCFENVNDQADEILDELLNTFYE